MELTAHAKVEASDIEDSQPAIVKRARHNWTTEQRLTLAVLASYGNDWRQLTSVFNRFHRSDLRRCGGLRTAVVATQYHDMRHWFDAAGAAKKLHTTLSPYDRSKRVSRARLEKEANEIGIALKTTGCKRKRADPTYDDRTDFLPSQSDDESRETPHLQTGQDITFHPKTPLKANSKQQANGLLTPPDSGERKKIRLTTDKRLARIGFRAFTAKTQGTYTPALGIRAGAFLNSPTIPLARDLEATKFREEAL